MRVMSRRRLRVTNAAAAAAAGASGRGKVAAGRLRQRLITAILASARQACNRSGCLPTLLPEHLREQFGRPALPTHRRDHREGVAFTGRFPRQEQESKVYLTITLKRNLECHESLLVLCPIPNMHFVNSVKAGGSMTGTIKATCTGTHNHTTQYCALTTVI
ncbi:uncharacterized protein LOC119573525 [Penaeus monodon]|uniref:uncharacterized protein LOC119573525 n=1 Tax=Penaeus monodon TaxID=6687 RepID=UPI0018A6FCDA|nr:uncharacterized protein LOC119573525 [Penaeus monodon]